MSTRNSKQTCRRSPLTMRSKGAAPLRAPPSIFVGHYVRSIGSETDRHFQLIDNEKYPLIMTFSNLCPCRIAVSSDGTLLYVTNLNPSKPGVHVLRSSDGSYVRPLCNGSQLVASSVAICVDGDHLLVTCAEASQVHVIHIPSETLVRTIGRQGDAYGEGTLNLPVGVCVFADLVYVCDEGAGAQPENSRVLVFQLSTGAFLRTIGAQGSGPTRLGKLNSMCLSPDGEQLFVADGSNHCVHVLRTSDGAHVSSFGSKGSGDDQLDYPFDVCVSPSGEWLFVADSRNKRVQVLRASDGTLACTLGLEGTSLGCAVCPSQGIAYVSDSVGVDRIHVFSL